MRLAFINHVTTFQINCGLAYIMTVAGREYNVRLFDINPVGSSSFEGYLRTGLFEYKPDFICFSVNSFSLGTALFWSRLCRAICPQAKIVYGGVHPTIMPDQTIEYGEVDYICIGEGEETIVDFLASYEKNPKTVVPGIWKKDPSGRIIKSPLRPYVKDIDSLPMLNLDYWNMKLYLSDSGEFGGGLGILSSRGCVYSCNFCSAPALRGRVPGSYFRLRSPHLVAEEIDYQYKRYKHLGIGYLHFDDACFGYDIEHLSFLTEELGKRGFPYGLVATCQTHPLLIGQEWIALVKKMGCRHVAIGVEAGDENIRINIHNKKVTNKQITEMERNLKKEEIPFSFYMIMGAPQETFISVLRTVWMLLRSRPAKVLISFFTPLPGSKLAEKYKLDISFGKESKPYFAFSSFRSRPIFLVIAYVCCKGSVFVLRGLRLRSWKFLADIIKYVFNLDGSRSFSLFNRRALSELYRKTIVQYEIRRDNK
jgi:anaerobic magnesium-protoporphyrin IX monomethyl ester cyclase